MSQLLNFSNVILFIFVVTSNLLSAKKIGGKPERLGETFERWGHYLKELLGIRNL